MASLTASGEYTAEMSTANTMAPYASESSVPASRDAVATMNANSPQADIAKPMVAACTYKHPRRTMTAGLIASIRCTHACGHMERLSVFVTNEAVVLRQPRTRPIEERRRGWVCVYLTVRVGVSEGARGELA